MALTDREEALDAVYELIETNLMVKMLLRISVFFVLYFALMRCACVFRFTLKLHAFHSPLHYDTIRLPICVLRVVFVSSTVNRELAFSIERF